MCYLYISLGRRTVVNKGIWIFGGKLLLSFVMLCEIAAESLVTSAADSSGSS